MYPQSMNRTDRLMGILLELQARGDLRAEDLARRFEVSVRTVYRDLQALSEGGVPLVAMPGKGYRLMEGYFLPPLTFTATEAALLVLGGEFVRERVDAGLRASAADALRKLTAVLPAERRAAVERWQREILFPTYGTAADEPKLTQIRSAIQERRVVRLLYHAFRRPAPEWREVEPVSLIYLTSDWQLAAYCRLRQAPRTFRLDRIDGLDPLGDRFALSDRHTLDRYRGAGMAGLAEAHVRFDPAVERWVRERQPFTFLREELDAAGPIFVYALREGRDLIAWLLSWGATFEVLSPPDLGARIAREAHRMLGRHTQAVDQQFREISAGAPTS